MQFDIEFYLWGVIPFIVSLIVAAWSVYASAKRKDIANWMLTAMIVGLLVFANATLYTIFINDAYPTFIPHLLVCFSLLVALMQKIRK